MEEWEEIQVMIRKEVLIRGFLYLLNKEGLLFIIWDNICPNHLTSLAKNTILFFE